jgi:hypothetical protein
LQQNRISIPKCNIIMLNIYIFNTFVAKIITSYLTFGNKVHKSKNICYNIEWQGINARNRYYIPLNNKLKIDVNYMYIFGIFFTISDMYSKDVRLIITRKKII